MRQLLFPFSQGKFFGKSSSYELLPADTNNGGTVCTISVKVSHLILWCPLFLLPSIFPSIRDFSNEPSVHIRWPKYWSFSFTISPSSEYSGLISLKIDWLDILAVQGTFRNLLQHHSSKASIFWHSASLQSSSQKRRWPLGRPWPWLYGPLSAEWYLCFSTHCLDLSSLSCQEAIVFWFHGCSHCPVILEPKKKKSVSISTFSFYLPWSNGARCHALSFFNIQF